MPLEKTKLDGVLVFTPRVFEDERGFFMESFNEKFFNEVGVSLHFVQDNHSLTKTKGTIRGLHFQTAPKAQSKLVRVVAGEIFDVAVDLREASPTYGKWFGVRLSAQNKKQLFVPKGFAHGFQTLTENTEVLYKVDDFYAPENERGIIFNCDVLNINWPIKEAILLDRDKKWPGFWDAVKQE